MKTGSCMKEIRLIADPEELAETNRMKEALNAPVMVGTFRVYDVMTN